MKKCVLSTILLFTALVEIVRAVGDVSIGVDVGVLSNQNGTAISNGSLILLIASPSGNWQPISAGSYISGDEIIVKAFAADSSYSGITGETTFVWSYNYADIANFSPGEHIAVVWFPNITYSNYATLGTLPASGNYYGLFSATTDGGGGGVLPWLSQPVGTNQGTGDGYIMNTGSAGGTLSDNVGKATQQVSGVPEPSSLLLLAVGGVAMGALLRRRKA